LIVGTTTSLREPRDADESVLAAMRNDVVMQQLLLARPRPNSRARVQHWLASVADDPASVLFVIADAETDEAVGFLQVREIDLLSGHGRLGIAVRTDRQRRGYARQAIELAGPYLRDVFSLRKLVLDVRADNADAIALYDAVGFRSVGTLRGHHRVGEIYHDVVVMEKVFGE